MHPGGPTFDVAQEVDRLLALDGHATRATALEGAAVDHLPAVSKLLCERATGSMRASPGDAFDRARLARAAAARAGDVTQELAASSLVAQSALLLGRAVEALDVADDALASAKSVGLSDRSTFECEMTRIGALTHLERYDDARTLGMALVERSDRDGDRRGRIWTRMSLAELEFRIDEPREALRLYREVDALLAPGVQPGLLGALETNRANALEGVNRFGAAARRFALARGHFASAGHDHGVAQTDYNAAYALSLRGLYHDALRNYGRLETEFRRLGDERHLAHVDLDRAEIHLHLHLGDDARAFALRARERFETLGLRKEAALARQFAGCAARIVADLDAADVELASAASEFRHLGLGERYVGATLQRARLALDLSHVTQARQLADLASGAITASMNPLARLSVDLTHARIDLAEHRLTEALRRADHARATQGHAMAPWALIESHWIRAKALALLGHEADAIAAYEAAIDALERCRGGVPPDEYMTAFLAGRSALYQEIVDLLVRRGDVVRGFVYAERAKSRALVELLTERSARAPDAGPEDVTARRVRVLRERLNAIYRRLSGAEGESGARGTRATRRARHQAARIEGAVGRLIREGRLNDREAVSLVGVDVPDLAEVQRGLEEGTALVEYYLTVDALVTFVVTRDSIRVERREIAAASIRLLLERFRFHLARLERGVGSASDLVARATQANLEQMSDVLLPSLDGLDGITRLVVVPHGLLHHVPFHALPLEGGAVIDRFEVVYAPSATVYAWCRRERETSRGAPVVFALPDEMAPRIEDEGTAVARRLKTSSLHLREEATFERLKEACRDARVVHVATHGMFRPEQPMLSSIRLADRWMNLYDVYGLDVRAELVVLSTCESGIADVTDGDEILGLTRGFLYAGAPALMTTQWRIDDDVTTEFMDAFYRALDVARDAAAAHRAAALEIRARHPHPYCWAPFFLTGRPIVRVTTRDEGPGSPDPIECRTESVPSPCAR